MKRAAVGFSIDHRPATETDRRKTARYTLTFPVLFRWMENETEERQGGGFSRDVSSGGIYVACDRECHPLNAKVRLEVLVPSTASQAIALKLTAQGDVVRMNKSATGSGFAASAGFALDALSSAK
jgi:hypothetical protein